MRTRRMIAAGAVLAATVGIVLAAVRRRAARGRHRDPADAAGPLDIRAMGVDQATRDVRLHVRTQGRFGLGQLNRRPDTPSRTPASCACRSTGPARPACASSASGPSSTARTCSATRGSAGTARSSPSSGSGARVKRHGPRSIAARFRADAAGLAPHVYFWRYEPLAGAGLRVGPPVTARVPARGEGGPCCGQRASTGARPSVGEVPPAPRAADGLQGHGPSGLLGLRNREAGRPHLRRRTEHLHAAGDLDPQAATM